MKRYFVLILAVLMLVASACSGTPGLGVGAENVGRDVLKGCSQEVVESTRRITIGTVAEIRTVTNSSNYTLLRVVNGSSEYHFGVWGTKISKFLNEGDRIQAVSEKQKVLYEVCGNRRELVKINPIEARRLVVTDEVQHNPSGSISFIETDWIKIELTDITILPKSTPPKTITVSK